MKAGSSALGVDVLMHIVVGEADSQLNDTPLPTCSNAAQVAALQVEKELEAERKAA